MNWGPNTYKIMPDICTSDFLAFCPLGVQEVSVIYIYGEFSESAEHPFLCLCIFVCAHSPVLVNWTKLCCSSQCQLSFPWSSSEYSNNFYRLFCIKLTISSTQCFHSGWVFSQQKGPLWTNVILPVMSFRWHECLGKLKAEIQCPT